MLTAVINDKNNPDIVSDLTDEEFTKFKDAGAPNTNDVLDMHAYLKILTATSQGFSDIKCKQFTASLVDLKL